MMNEHGQAFRTQLCEEITCVEKILELASDPLKLKEASSLSMNFMKTQRTNSIDSVEVSEYIGFISDRVREIRAGDIEGARGSEENIVDSLGEITKMLNEAKQKLEK
jgi:hypothetical protein